MASRFLEKITSLPELETAWLRVRANGGKAGADGVNLSAFSTNLGRELLKLRGEVLNGAYRPLPMLAMNIPKPGEGFRRLAIPAVRDRVLQTAYVRELAPILEPQFENCSYAYRPGRSIRMAVQAVLDYFRTGCQWCLDGDIDHFFENVGYGRLLAILAPLFPEPEALALLESWLHGELIQS